MWLVCGVLSYDELIMPYGVVIMLIVDVTLTSCVDELV